MGIFDVFKKPSKTSDDLFDAARKQTNLEGLYGGRYMSPELFQKLARTMAVLERRVDWLTLLGGSASGYLSGSVLGRQLCKLRPIHNDKTEGLAFTTTLIPLPSSERMSVLSEMMRGMNDIMFVATGAALEPDTEKIYFTTIMLKGPSGYTDAKLTALVNMNLAVGDEILRALITVYQQQTTSGKAMYEFSAAFQRFMTDLPAEVQSAYLWAFHARQQ